MDLPLTKGVLFGRPKLINKCHFLNKLLGLAVAADFYRRDRLGLVRRRIKIRLSLPFAPQPLHRAVQQSGVNVAIPILAGLHHQYVRI